MAKIPEMTFEETPGEESDPPDTIELPDGADMEKLKGLVVPVKTEAPDENEGVPDDLKGLTKAQLAAKLKEQPTTDPNLLATLQGLTSALKPKADGDEDEEPSVVQKPSETDEEFWKRSNVDVFDPEKMQKTFPQAVMRSMAPAFLQLATKTMMLNRRVLRSDSDSGPIFKRFEGEVETEAKKLMKKMGPDPEVYEKALENIKKRHAGELETESVEEKVKARVAEELKKRGIDGEDGGKEQPSPQPRRAFQQAGGSSSLPSGGGKTKYQITERMKVMAAKQGISPEVLARRMAKGG